MEQKNGNTTAMVRMSVACQRVITQTLLQYTDGSKTTGLNTYSGIIGKQLEVCEKLRDVVFEEIEREMPDVDYAELSTHQKYLHDICNAVRSG